MRDEAPKRQDDKWVLIQGVCKHSTCRKKQKELVPADSFLSLTKGKAAPKLECCKCFRKSVEPTVITRDH